MRKLTLRRLSQITGVVVGTLLTAGSALAETTLDVLYTTPGTFTALQQELAKRFTQEHPDIKIKFRTPAAGYEEAAQQILRDNITGSLPDVAFNGINQIGLFVDRGIGAPVDDLIEKDGGVDKLGYYPTLAALGRWKGKSYGFPFAVSTPVLYVNGDLVEKAGLKVEDLPKDWEGLVSVGKKIEAATDGSKTGLYFQWEQTGNWLVQSLITSRGGKILTPNGCNIAFNDDKGMWALKTLEAFGKAGMPSLSLAQARQAFVAGNIAILADSTSYVAAAQKQIGSQFTFRTVKFPLAADDGKLPAGGNVAMIFTKDDKRREAAWEYVKFVTGPVGQTEMANLTGYMPGNELAVTNPDLLGNFYKNNPNHQTSIDQLPLLGEWTAFPGENSLKIIDAIKKQTEALVTGKATAEETMKSMVTEVQSMMPKCSE